MAYICTLPAGSCSKCAHYRFDEERDGMSCFAEMDERNGRPSKDKQSKRLTGLYFGAPLYYVSPVDGHKTSCVFVGHYDDRAVVLFPNADGVARVDYSQLEWRRAHKLACYEEDRRSRRQYR